MGAIEKMEAEALRLKQEKEKTPDKVPGALKASPPIPKPTPEQIKKKELAEKEKEIELERQMRKRLITGLVVAFVAYFIYSALVGDKLFSFLNFLDYIGN